MLNMDDLFKGRYIGHDLAALARSHIAEVEKLLLSFENPTLRAPYVKSRLFRKFLHTTSPASRFPLTGNRSTAPASYPV
jgi:hypothetical protein